MYVCTIIKYWFLTVPCPSLTSYDLRKLLLHNRMGRHCSTAFLHLIFLLQITNSSAQRYNDGSNDDERN